MPLPVTTSATADPRQSSRQARPRAATRPISWRHLAAPALAKWIPETFDEKPHRARLAELLSRRRQRRTGAVPRDLPDVEPALGRDPDRRGHDDRGCCYRSGPPTLRGAGRLDHLEAWTYRRSSRVGCRIYRGDVGVSAFLATGHCADGGGRV